MKVYVIMGNDFPSGVVSSEVRAKEIVEKLKALEKAALARQSLPPRIYWRYYEFELDKFEA